MCTAPWEAYAWLGCVCVCICVGLYLGTGFSPFSGALSGDIKNAYLVHQQSFYSSR